MQFMTFLILNSYMNFDRHGYLVLINISAIYLFTNAMINWSDLNNNPPGLKQLGEIMLFLVGAILTVLFTFKKQISSIIEFDYDEKLERNDIDSSNVPICLINNNFVTGNMAFNKEFIESEIEQSNLYAAQIFENNEEESNYEPISLQDIIVENILYVNFKNKKHYKILIHNNPDNETLKILQFVQIRAPKIYDIENKKDSPI